jgi:hypothetical protein
MQNFGASTTIPTHSLGPPEFKPSEMKSNEWERSLDWRGHGCIKSADCTENMSKLARRSRTSAVQSLLRVTMRRQCVASPDDSPHGLDERCMSSLVRLLGFTTLGCGCVVGRYRELATSREVAYIEEKGRSCSSLRHRRNHTVAAERPTPVAPIAWATTKA